MTDDALFKDLPDPAAARRFLDELAARHPSQSRKLIRHAGLLSDALVLAAYSPLLSTTLLQHPEYLWWLGRHRSDSVVRSKGEFLESLARFALTNSQIDTHDILSRFRRRELMRIFLRDIRRLVTIAEITEEISNLADAILEHALRVARQELDNRFGQPQETDERGRNRPAEFCIISLGKLGSRELNYSSDIDLLFFYSGEGVTTGNGSRGSVSNREYFIKLAETIIRLIGHQSGEGSAYRVDLRLRPHGRVGPLALSIADTLRYYRDEAKPWERQVLIRSRASTGGDDLYKKFWAEIQSVVFPPDESVEEALKNVRESKQKIDLEQINTRGTDVKLGKGGIREIEFIAQALQLAHGGRDLWLRSPHTLISLSRLADRRLISEAEHTALSEAYTYLRQLEHILQMENGLQTHLVPNELTRRELVARRMRLADAAELDRTTALQMKGVHGVFTRVFGKVQEAASNAQVAEPVEPEAEVPDAEISEHRDRLSELASQSVRLSEMLAARPHLAVSFTGEVPKRDYFSEMLAAVHSAHGLAGRLSAMRVSWSQLMFEIVAGDMMGVFDLATAKRLQTDLSEASLASAFETTRIELESRFGISIPDLSLAVLGLGKIGGAGLDYDSDLDLVMVYEDRPGLLPPGVTASEFFSRAVEIMTTALSSITRDGSLYRVDLRLRPFGSDGPIAVPATAFAEYMREKAAIWELLAFVKLRGVGGNMELAASTERAVREVIHRRAEKIPPAELAAESRRIRSSLEKLRTERRFARDIDIKYGEGGMLDIYFATRFLQLRDNSPDIKGGRSTASTLERLAAANSLSREYYAALDSGYRFLSMLDHQLRLILGRTTRLPMGNRKALGTIARRMSFDSVEEMLAQLNACRISIRAAYDAILDGSAA